MNSMLSGLISEIWHTFNEAAIYILFGILIAGIIQTFLDKDKIAKYLGKPGLKTVILAALFGIPLPLCSCGVIPTAISLKKNGASKGAVLSFLISTPESGISSMPISYAMLDPIMTFFRPLGAFITGVTAGVAENIFGKKDVVSSGEEKPCCCSCGHSEAADHNGLAHKFKAGMRYAFGELLGDIAGWLALGIVIGGVIAFFVPPSFIQNYLGSGWRAMLIMLVAGIPLYICASASTPIAAALIAKGMSPGVAFVFLLAGPATNISSVLMIGKFLGRRSAAIYLVSIALCAVLLGTVLNGIYLLWGINIKATLGHACCFFSPKVEIFSSIVLLILMLNVWIKKARQ